MAPEQARGRAVDKRSDIWAFGCVLYEMLVGKRAFDDEDVSMTLSKILQREPDLDALPGDVPARVRQTLRVCLRKDSKQRVGDIRDVRLALEGAFETAAPQIMQPAAIARPLWRRTLPGAVAAVGAVLLSGLTAWSLWPTAEPQVTRFEYTLPADQQFRNTGRAVIAFSRDGRRLVYNTGRGLYLRALDELEAHVIPGTEASLTSPFFSPDGQSVGYWQEGQLKRSAVSGGAPVVISPADNPFGVSWETDDTILFGQAKGIMRVPASGGTPELVIPAKEGEHVHGPQLLPDGDSVLFSATTLSGASRWDVAQVVVQSLRSSRREVVLQGGSDARYVPTGHLVYALKDGLFAVPFDADRRRVTGGAVPMAQNIRRAAVPALNTASANYAVSEQGTLVYVKAIKDTSQGTLTWVARDGRETPLSTIAVEQPRNPRLSPDGERLALIVAGDLWVYNVAGRPPIRLTSNGDNYSPLWTPDGQRLVYDASSPGSNVLILPADGSAATGQPVSPAGHFHPYGWSADGSELVAVRTQGASNGDIDIVRWALAKADVVQPVVETPANEGFFGTMVSPDGRWLAYASDQTGRQEIWVRPFPGPGAAVRISPNGGVEPVWARNSRELYYLEDTQLMAVAVAPGNRFDFSRPIRLLAYDYLRSSQPPSYDVAPDGRFLMLKPLISATVPLQIVVIQNWDQELKRLVPTK
jgi:eukaryotic-like serine/threonine-protein kinase